jgi:hypothetical protein
MEVQAYWDRWFEQFGAYILHAAQIAEDNQVEALALGKQLVGAMVLKRRSLESADAACVRSITAAHTGSLDKPVFGLVADALVGRSGFLTIYDYSAISDADHPHWTS